MRAFTLLATLSITGCAVATQQIERPVVTWAPGSDYQLVWSDEFDVDGRPDPAKWTYENGFVRNNELQWYQSDNAFVENGLLIIEGREENRPNPTYGDPNQKPGFRERKSIDYSSASVTTRGLHSWKYGVFEIRARLKAEEGLWPAIWFLGDEGRWPSNGEIDVMEYYEDSILANFAWAGDRLNQATWDAAKIPMSEIGGPDWDQSFHVWRMEWSETEISLFLDDVLLNHIDVDTAKNVDGAVVQYPFKQPQYLLLNLALGGNRGGSVENTLFPSRYEVDYVRVYQKR